jgi:hypothetical protein
MAQLPKAPMISVASGGPAIQASTVSRSCVGGRAAHRSGYYT